MLPAPRWAAGLVCLGSWLVPGAAVRAQGEPLTRGQEVRVFVTGVAGAFEGRLVGVNAQSVTVQLQNGTAFTLQTAQIQRAEVLGTRTNMRRGAVVGGGVGLGVGVAWAIASREDCGAGACAGSGDRFDGWKLIIPAVAGAAAGALVGNSIESPRWMPGLVPGRTADGAAGLGLTWRVPVGPGASRQRGA